MGVGTIAMLHIVLVNPQIPQNTGNIARTCAVTGAALHLIKPLGFMVDDKHLKRAGLDYWHMLDITYYDSLGEFLDIAPGPVFCFTTKAGRGYSGVDYPDNCCLLFGREDAGLPVELLRSYPDNCLRLPMCDGARSLNLSNTVAVAVYEALRQWGFPELRTRGTGV